MKNFKVFIGLYKPAIVPLGLLPQINLVLILITFIILCVVCPDPYFEKDKYYYISLITLLGFGVILVLGCHQEFIGVIVMSAAFIVVHTIYWRKYLNLNDS